MSTAVASKALRRVITQEEWMAEAKAIFGDIHHRDWKFVCPVCNTPQSMQDLVDAGVKPEEVDKYIAFSCIGRFTREKGCDWTLGGLFKIHRLEVISSEDGYRRPMFEFYKGEKAK